MTSDRAALREKIASNQIALREEAKSDRAAFTESARESDRKHLAATELIQQMPAEIQHISQRPAG